MIYILIYFISVSLISILLMFIDKGRAKRKEWRISERTLWTIALLGGSLGIWIGMKQFRHKTKHKSFRFGIPLILLIHIGAFIYFAQNLS